MLVMLAVGAASVALRVAQLDAAPFAEWAEQSRHVEVEGVLASDPEFVDRASFGAADTRQVRVELMVREARSGAEAIALRTPVLAVGGGSGWEDLRLGDRVSLAGSLRPAPSARPLAAYLFTDDASRAPGR